MTVTLADQVLPLVRTRTDLHRWRPANDYGSQLHDAVTLLQDAAENEPPADVLAGFRQAPRGLWVLAGVCCLLFLIWVSDAATVYSFMIGAGDAPVGEGGLAARVLRFHLWTSLMGAVLAAIVFCITAFAVPLLFDGRASLVQAVTASVRAVFASPGALLVWALVLAAAVIATIHFPPLLMLSLPCLAFASDLLYLEVFPPEG